MLTVPGKVELMGVQSVRSGCIGRDAVDGEDAMVKVDLLLIGAVAAGTLARAIRNWLPSAGITVVQSEVAAVASLLGTGAFDMILLKMAASPGAEDLEAVRAIRFAKKRTKHLLFVCIIPEHFEDCISGHGADIILIEPLTTEKMNILINYWKIYFSKSGRDEKALVLPEPQAPRQRHAGTPQGHLSTHVSPESLDELELNSPLSDTKKSQRSSLHSNKERLRRERIKDCCEQLRALLPFRKGRKNDVASILEATVQQVQRVRDRVPPDVLGQITVALQSNWRFCKKPPLPGSSLPSVTETHSTVETQDTSGRLGPGLHPSCHMDIDVSVSVMEMMKPARGHVSACPVPTAEDLWDVGVTASSGSTLENVIVLSHVRRRPLPGLGRLLGPLPAALPVSCSSEVATSHEDAAHVSSAGPTVPRILPQPGSSLADQSCALCPDRPDNQMTEVVQGLGRRESAWARCCCRKNQNAELRVNFSDFPPMSGDSCELQALQKILPWRAG
ncbi:PREDICTED: spermatogenesis- and oogenesis-specific basic helix-loop-helix-containing protein 2 [Elephantulus edwardii]|uniref:spermatogenesis- and oogenesis-specific basic helix-loop-helix-containing protein 2 n=1 Tax=Elephantulus edwardii TaxID=28737 RepID=UPI0003F077F0|nr:PREDICTED: spermatogenesis- and oogenesis-specific basic helix-loop-helix-containing protein 2 [Elephantulus edwardii]